MSGGFGFYFEEARRSRSQGAVASEEEHFEGSSAEKSVARELGQNSLDAIDLEGDGVVRMVFELCEMSTAAIPDIDSLRQHLVSVAEATKGTKGHERMETAVGAAHRDTVMVLRVGDYGTKGLLGSEGVGDTKSPLVALTRGAGISANDGGRGGSFGIGSAVGPMSSELCTVLWTSLAKNKEDVVFAGYSRLATHKDSDGVLRQADGFYTRLSNTEDFDYLRNPKPIGPFAQRTEFGTDVYILGYRKAANDPALIHIRNAFVSDFFFAIHEGKLTVEGRTPEGGWTLDASTIREVAESLPDVRPFYRALHDPEPYVGEVSGLGELRLFVEVDDTLPRKLHTMTVRAPRMRIGELKHTSISAKYAAILDCSNDTANERLRMLEPPLHDKWDPGRAPDGNRICKSLQEFVRNGLLAKVRAQVGEEVKLDGLQRLLPSNLGPDASEYAEAGQVAGGDGVVRESATVQGKPADELAVTNPKKRSVTVKVVRPASNEGNDATEKGKDSGGSGTRKGGGTGLPGTGAVGDGRAKIRSGDITLRSWTDPKTGDLIVVVRSKTPVSGDLTLAPLVAGGEVEAAYNLPIRQVLRETHDGARVLLHDGNTIQGLELDSEALSARMRIELEEPHRFRIGVI